MAGITAGFRKERGKGERVFSAQEGARGVSMGLVLLAVACVRTPSPRGPVDRQPAPPQAPTAFIPAADIRAVRQYIGLTWGRLTRSHDDLVAAARDPKLNLAAGTPWPVYLPATEDLARVREALASALGPTKVDAVALLPLPSGPQPPAVHGLLYLPKPYVVPGGRFNELYGWDSYFIVLGLLADGRVELARDITDNLLYEVRHYGTVLNANRTYYLTRSQPPLLSEMVLAVFRATGDRKWLSRAFPLLVTFHETWMQPPHLVPDTGLSRYFDRGEGPAPEVVASERDATGLTHYDRVKAAFRGGRVPPGFPVERYYDPKLDVLTPLFFQGDRAMRESGFDPTDRFGPFGAETTQILPVCLNALLHQMELDLSEMALVLGQREAALGWRHRAQTRKQQVNTYLWDEARGLYLDYDLTRKQRRPYVFATTFYPLWAGLASPEKARRLAESVGLLLRPGGLLTSTQVSGSQWDAPFGWAPLQHFAVAGFRAYGEHDAARKIARAFGSLVIEDFLRTGVIVEKYDVLRRRSDVERGIRFGYAENQVGFGWTNGVLLLLLPWLEGVPHFGAAVGPSGGVEREVRIARPNLTIEVGWGIRDRNAPLHHRTKETE